MSEILDHNEAGDLIANFASNTDAQFNVPEGIYDYRITSAKLEPSKDKQSMNIVVEGKIRNGEHADAPMTSYLNLKPGGAMYYTRVALEAITGMDLERDGVNISEMIRELPGYDCRVVIVETPGTGEYEGRTFSNIDSFLPEGTGETGVGQDIPPSQVSGNDEGLKTFQQSL